MLHELYIEEYRGIKKLALQDLGKVNIIAGANNTGKTSVLEVIRSLEAPSDLSRWRMIGRREETNPRSYTTVYDTLKALFPDNTPDEGRIKYSGSGEMGCFDVELLANRYDTIVTGHDLKETFFSRVGSREKDMYDIEYETEAIDINVKINGESVGKTTVYSMQGGWPRKEREEVRKILEKVIYVSPTQHTQNSFFLDSIMNDVELYERFVEVMRLFDPGFVSINSVETERGMGRKYIVLSKNHKEGLLLNAYGDGMKKAMLLLSAVVRAKEGGVLLLDEFETAIHVSVMKDVFSWVIKTANELGVQIFMTSHSLEAIEEVLKCTPFMQKDMRMITLVKVNDELKVRNVDGEKAVQLLDEYGLELR